VGRDTVDELLEQWREERPELDVSALAIAVRIEMLAKLMKQNTAQSLAQVGLKTWEYDVLSGLRRQGPPFEVPTTQLAKESLLTSGTMTTRIDQLEERGLVKRKPDPDDRRSVRVSLTESGVALIDGAIQSRLTAADVNADSLSRKERVVFENGLRKLLVSLGPSE
jgi:DNA-binding MarR family transcriptional regulator